MRTIAALVCALVCLPALAAPAALRAERVDAALPAFGFPAGSRVAASSLERGTLTVEFTSPTAAGLTDAALEGLTDAVRAAWRDDESITDTVLTCGGRPLSDYLPPVPVIPPAPAPRSLRGVSGGALTGRVIAVSPGHGWYHNGSSWTLQRGYWQGIVEDFLNPEMIQYLYNLLANNGATVVSTREMDKTYGDAKTSFTFAGSTRPAPNKPWWQMASLYYTQRVGAPSSVYDNGRDTDYNRDIAARPLYANWKGADIMVSLHNNGGGGTGTETLYDNANASKTGSQNLATKVNTRVINELRANYLSTWYNRGAQGFAGSYGENRIANCPAVLIEVAFMDMPTPDNAALHDEKFKMLVAKAIYEGICDYFGVTPTWNTNVAAPGGQWTAQPLPKQWSVKLGSPINAAPSSAGGWVYAGTDAGVLYGVAGTAASGYTPGTIRWRYPASSGLGAAIAARPSVYGGSVYAVTKAGKLVSVNRLTGALQWTVSMPNSGSVVASPAPTADGLLIAASDNGRLYCYSQTDGTLLKALPQPFGAINAQVAVPDSGHVWVGSHDGKVRCVSSDLSAILWEVDTHAAVDSAPYVLTATNSVFLANAAKTVFALNASNGGPAAGWTLAGATFGYNIGTSLFADAASGAAVFGMDNHTISAVTVSGASVPASYPLRPFGVKEFTAAPVVVNGTVYMGGTDGRVYALEPGTGVTAPGSAWRAFDAHSEPQPGQFTATACVTGTGPDDRLVIGNTNGTLYAFPL